MFNSCWNLFPFISHKSVWAPKVARVRKLQRETAVQIPFWFLSAISIPQHSNTTNSKAMPRSWYSFALTLQSKPNWLLASQVVAQEPGQTSKSPGNKFLAMHKMLHFRTCGANYQEKQLLTNSDQFPQHRSTCDHCLDLKPPQNISCACNVVAPRQLAVWCKASETLESDGLLARAFWQDMLEA